MSLNDNHNHFCIYCGAKLMPNQKFCIQCGKAVFYDDFEVRVDFSKYDDELNKLEYDYNSKQKKALDLIEKLSGLTNNRYDDIVSSIHRSNKLFNSQLDVTRSIIKYNTAQNESVEKEIVAKISVLKSFIGKMDDLINEIVIQLSSSKDDDEDIKNLFTDMDELIHSMKDY